MQLVLVPISLIFAVINNQQESPDSYADLPDNLKITADSIVRWSVRDDGSMIVATTKDAFPDNDGTTERVEVINLGKNYDGDSVFLATVQDSGHTLAPAAAEFEAKAFDVLLPEPGSHFGTSAHADKSIKTIGLIMVLGADGKLKWQMMVPDVKKAFLAGAFDGKVTIAIETEERAAIISAMSFVDRVRNHAPLILGSEGRAKEDGETLTRAEQDEMMPVMAAVKNGTVSYYDQGGNKLEKVSDGGTDSVVRFPGVDSRGRQSSDKVIKVTATGETTGTVERYSMAANAK